MFIKHKGKPSTQNAQSQQITVKCEAMLGKAVLQCLSQGICYWLLLEIGLYEMNSSAEPADDGSHIFRNKWFVWLYGESCKHYTGVGNIAHSEISGKLKPNFWPST